MERTESVDELGDHTAGRLTMLALELLEIGDALRKRNPAYS